MRETHRRGGPRCLWRSIVQCQAVSIGCRRHASRVQRLTLTIHGTRRARRMATMEITNLVFAPQSGQSSPPLGLTRATRRVSAVRVSARPRVRASRMFHVETLTSGK